MGKRIDRIVIVGGGSAGWLSAAYLAKHFQCHQPDSVQITLVESDEVGTIGVGEATIPTIRATLNYLGIDETSFMRATSATFKQAIRFDDWLHLPNADTKSSYYHVFQKPIVANGEAIAPYWVMNRDKHGKSFVDYATIQGRVCDAGLAPFKVGDKKGPGSLNYAYHFDAGQFAELLKKYSVERGVKHVVGHVTNAICSEDGYISKLNLKDDNTLGGDLFIDCTGFAGHLIEKKMKSAFTDQTSVLFCDRAVTVQVPYDAPTSPIRPYTTSTAMKNGWIWDIGLDNRRGIGHVYSSRHTDDTEAEKILREYVGPIGNDRMPRHLKMRIGYRKEPWVKNCIAIGLAAGFIEPLESTGINQVEISLNRIKNIFTRHGDIEYMASRFNRQMAEWFELTFDFIKIHYCLSRRTDSDFWIENRLPETVPDRLKHQLKMWLTRPANQSDLAERRSTFGEVSYHQILFGLDHIPELAGEVYCYPNVDIADVRAIQNSKRLQQALRRLPEHRSVIDQLNGLSSL